MNTITYLGQSLTREEWEKVIQQLMSEALQIRRVLDEADDERDRI